MSEGAVHGGEGASTGQWCVSASCDFRAVPLPRSDRLR